MAVIASEARLRGSAPAPGSRRGADARPRIDAARVGYLLAALAVLGGWAATRDRMLVDPLIGLGYWLGIVGASLMGLLLLYPIRKRVRLFRHLGATKHWFRLHMIFGVLGPVLILYHCNFRPGSMNSTVALVCTLLVAGSGLVGRYLHARVFSDLSGHRQDLASLMARARISREQRRHVSVLAPELLERMQAFDAVVLAPPGSFLGSLLLPVKLAFTTRFGHWRLSRYARRQIREQARRSPVIRGQRRRLQQATVLFIAQHLRRVRRVAELNSWERMFSLWHIFHLPFFYMLVLTALIHVLAVHMY